MSPGAACYAGLLSLRAACCCRRAVTHLHLLAHSLTCRDVANGLHLMATANGVVKSSPAPQPKMHCSYDSIHLAINSSLAKLPPGGYAELDYLLAISGGALRLAVGGAQF